MAVMSSRALSPFLCCRRSDLIRVFTRSYEDWQAQSGPHLDRRSQSWVDTVRRGCALCPTACAQNECVLQSTNTHKESAAFPEAPAPRSHNDTCHMSRCPTATWELSAHLRPPPARSLSDGDEAIEEYTLVYQPSEQIDPGYTSGVWDQRAIDGSNQ